MRARVCVGFFWVGGRTGFLVSDLGVDIYVKERYYDVCFELISSTKRYTMLSQLHTTVL